MESLKDKACVVGIGETEYSKYSGRSEAALACEAIKKAADDAGISVKEIDGVVKMRVDLTSEAAIATNLGLENLRFFGDVGYGGGGCGGTIVHAAMAVALGVANYVVCYRALNGFSHRERMLPVGDKTLNPYDPFMYGDPSFGWPWGLAMPAQMYALLARRHMHEYGTTREHLGWIAITHRKHALKNPKATMRKPMTMEDYLNSRWVAEPFCLYDCCLNTDGGAAVIVTSAERAKNLKQRPVYIMGAAQGTGPLPCAGHNRPDLTRFTYGEYVAKELYKMAGVGPKDIDVALIYDHFTFFVLATLEAYGFCKLGEGGPFVEGGKRIEVGGELPINPHGGLLSEAYIHAINHVVEAVRQLRGTSSNQVANAEIAMYTGSLHEAHGSLILRR